MRLDIKTLDDLDQAIARDAPVDYLYMYPPRQAYRPSADSNATLYSEGLAAGPEVNLYIHLPFCRQLCGFCNLFTSVASSGSDFDDYLAAIEAELDWLRSVLANRRIATVYIGGGTPSLLPVQGIERLLMKVQDITNGASREAREVAIEVDPNTVREGYLSGLREVGIDRINLGFQSFDDNEIRFLGRREGSSNFARVYEWAQDAGFRDVCVDLIYGLPGQSDTSWARSVESVLRLTPSTVCAYPLTRRPHTRFARHAHTNSVSEPFSRHGRYRMADVRLTEGGYRQETHVRWVRGQGGYVQKALHWDMGSVVGVGAGARSYLWPIDTRHGYSILDRHAAIQRYLQRAEAGDFYPTEGFEMNADERARKFIVLGLHNLAIERAVGLGLPNPVQRWSSELTALEDRGLVHMDDKGVSLTPRGMAYRDHVVQLFVSDRVRELVHGFDYRE